MMAQVEWIRAFDEMDDGGRALHVQEGVDRHFSKELEGKPALNATSCEKATASALAELIPITFERPVAFRTASIVEKGTPIATSIRA